MSAATGRRNPETRPQVPPPRPAPNWSSCGRRNAAVAWTPTPLLRPPQRSAPPAPPVPSLTDAAPGGSPDPRPGRVRWAERREICTPSLKQGDPSRLLRSPVLAPPQGSTLRPPCPPHPWILPHSHGPAPARASRPRCPAPSDPSHQALDDRPQCTVPGSLLGLEV